MMIYRFSATRDSPNVALMITIRNVGLCEIRKGFPLPVVINLVNFPAIFDDTATRVLANIPFICYFHIRILYSKIIFRCHIPLWYSVYIFHYHMQLLYSILIFHCYIPLITINIYIYIYSEVIFHYHIPLFSVIYSIIFDISMDNGKDYPIYYGKIKTMFQTTNQYIYIYIQYIYIYTV